MSPTAQRLIADARRTLEEIRAILALSAPTTTCHYPTAVIRRIR